MNISTFVTLTLVSVILSLLVQFGIMRYFFLHMKCSKGYVEKYSKLPKSKDHKRVIVTLSLKPEEINAFKPTLNSLLDQSVSVDSIVTNTENHKKYEIPEYVRQACQIGLAGDSFDEALALIPTLLREGEAGTVVISVQNGIVYGKDYIQTLLETLNDVKKPVVTEYGVCANAGDFKAGVTSAGRQDVCDWYKAYLPETFYLKYKENYSSIPKILKK